MEIRQIAEDIAVASQITAGDVEAIAGMGFKTLISNRPDSEQGAVPHDEIRAASEQAGIAFHYIPVVSGAITAANVGDMADAMAVAERPVLAYCRSGARCMNLFQLMQAAGK
ncbi:MAG: TIGR01244 family sulfur transferase [Rhizobiaceae bacterium]